MLTYYPGEVVAKLELALDRLLWDVDVSSRLHRRKNEIRILGHAEDVVLETLELERELVERGRAYRVRVINNEAVELVVVGISVGEVARLSRINVSVCARTRLSDEINCAL